MVCSMARDTDRGFDDDCNGIDEKHSNDNLLKMAASHEVLHDIKLSRVVKCRIPLQP